MRLPSAPLVEVFFELRWLVPVTGVAGQDIFYGYDPGYSALLPAFDAAMARAGLPAQELMPTSGPVFAHTILKRYRRSSAQPFPLTQIGHGVLACNLSTDYDWDYFQRFVLEQVDALLAAYPIVPGAPFTPARLELRYVDIFNTDLLGHASFDRFLGEQSQVSYQGLDYLRSGDFVGDDLGGIRLRRTIAKDGVGWFQYEINSGAAGASTGQVLISRVVRDGGFVARSSGESRAIIAEWLGNAHDITSKFFKSFVSTELMERFKTPS